MVVAYAFNREAEQAGLCEFGVSLMSSRIVRATWRNPVSETKTLKKEKKKKRKSCYPLKNIVR